MSGAGLSTSAPQPNPLPAAIDEKKWIDVGELSKINGFSGLAESIADPKFTPVWEKYAHNVLSSSIHASFGRLSLLGPKWVIWAPPLLT